MDSQFCCKNKRRRNAVRLGKDKDSKPILNGIDYLEVESDDQKTLMVYFLHNLPEQTDPLPPTSTSLGEDNILIEGGVRITDIYATSVDSDKNVLKVVVNQAGDFSRYKLRIIVSPVDHDPPRGFDPQLSWVEFSFKAGCPSEFDCKAITSCPPEKRNEPDIDYLTKDYNSFRRLILDRLNVILPNWRERSPADLQVVLVEFLAYLGDYLSYLQDAVATEAYLGTARKRISVRRHARLLDYPMHDGCNARTWVCIEVQQGGDADGKALSMGTRLLTGGPTGQRTIATPDLENLLQEEGPTVFETMHDVTLFSSHNRIRFYTWSDAECCLPKGAIRTTLRDDPALSLACGDVLLFEEVCSPTTGKRADADPTHRHAVRLTTVKPSQDPLDGTKVLEIEWHETDAMPFPLCISAIVTNADGIKEIEETGVARGNVVLADHGHAKTSKLQLAAEEPVEGYHSLKLPERDLTFSVQYDHGAATKNAASSVLRQDPRTALISRMNLQDRDEKWNLKRDLMESDRFSADFLVEMEADGEARLRFGNGVTGKKPPAGTTFITTYRVGNGRAGNVDHEAITRIVTGFKDIQRVRNPLAAVGGTDAETMEQVRQFAPHAFRTQERAVTEDDYAEVTERHSEVQKAAATFRWTGSWYTVFVTIDRKGGGTVDPAFKARIRQHLGKFRLAGYDLEINGPVFVPLDILIMVCVKPGYLRSHIKESMLKAFSSSDLPDGRRGFFHPDNFTVGQPVYLSQIYRCAMETAGVASVEVLKFQRWGTTARDEMDAGFLRPGQLEVIQLENDPNFPENGKIDFEMRGGQ